MQANGRTTHGALFIVVDGPGAAPHGRLGITVSKRVGNAVTRNRIKRWVREFARTAPPESWLPAGRDVVVIAKASAARATSFAEVARDLASLGARL